MNMTEEQAREMVMAHIAKNVLAWALDYDWSDEQTQRTLNDILAHPVAQEWIQQQIEMPTATRH